MTASETFEARRRERIDREYDELRAIAPEVFQRCVNAASTVVFNNGISDVKIAADIEAAMVSLALEARR